ncbi:MAG: 50S ribosomal protein L13 [bacterium]
MDMNKAFVLRHELRDPQWRVIDASGQILGRLATQIAMILRGKDKPGFTPQTDSGDYVVVVNCDKIALSGSKFDNKIYKSYSGWRGGLKERTAREVFAKDPARLIEHAVKGMLPRTKMGHKIIKKLKVYAGNEHPHQAQV